MSETPVPVIPPISRWKLVATMTALFAGVAAVIVYPAYAAGLLERVGPRALGLLLLAGSLLSRLRPARPSRLGIRLGRAHAVGFALLGAWAALLDDPLPIHWVASFAYGIAALVFWRSLEGGSSLIERFVGALHPYKPDFVGPYCRKVTAFWAGFFAVHALVLAGLAAAARSAAFAGYNARVMLPSMVLATVVEYLIRKTWFRYYPYGGPIDRLFSTFFPAEATEAGRRSQAYIRARQRALGGGAASGPISSAGRPSTGG